MNYLVMRLYAPLSSWGTTAVGEDRPTIHHPTRSAILGLLGAALGIKRDETQKLHDLSCSISIASKTYSKGTILRDYHTIQTPTTSKGVHFFTRKQELNSHKIETILSSRDYLEDGLWIVAIWLNPDKQRADLTYQFDLEQLKEALKFPKFTLYIGRKSCPPALPLSPIIINGNNIKSVLDVSIIDLLPTNTQNQTQAQKSDWEINELLASIASDRYLPTVLDTIYNKNNEYLSNNLAISQETEQADIHEEAIVKCRQVSYHWEGDINQMFADENIPTDVFTHHHWDNPTDRKQWQFTQRIGHEWNTLEPINTVTNMDATL